MPVAWAQGAGAKIPSGLALGTLHLDPGIPQMSVTCPRLSPGRNMTHTGDECG